MEVDATDTGGGAVLSQRASDREIHPGTYPPLKLSPVERNYDLGNRELLAFKLSLERHWLEGSEQPFFV